MDQKTPPQVDAAASEQVTVTDRLPDLAARIKAEHAQVVSAMKRGVVHAMAAGDLLIEAKALLKHGGWLPWLAEHCAIPARTASHYMRLARGRDKIGNVADLTVREALELLAKDDAPREEDDDEGDAHPDEDEGNDPRPDPPRYDPNKVDRKLAALDVLNRPEELVIFALMLLTHHIDERETRAVEKGLGLLDAIPPPKAYSERKRIYEQIAAELTAEINAERDIQRRVAAIASSEDSKVSLKHSSKKPSKITGLRLTVARKPKKDPGQFSIGNHQERAAEEAATAGAADEEN